MSLLILLIFVLTGCSTDFNDDLKGINRRIGEFYKSFQDEQGAKTENFLREHVVDNDSSGWLTRANEWREKAGAWFMENAVGAYNAALRLTFDEMIPFGEQGWKLAKENLGNILNKYPNILEKIKYGTE